MSDYIKREDAMAKQFRYLLPNGKMSLPVVFVKDIENLPTADALERLRWIPVTERLPQDGKRVIALSKDGVVRECNCLKSYVPRFYFGYPND